MIKINSEVLKQFDKEGLSINEGIAIDARLVQSASRPISNDEIKKFKEKKESPEGKLDNNSSRYKFLRYFLRRLFKYFFPIPVFKYRSRCLTSSSLIQAS